MIEHRNTRIYRYCIVWFIPLSTRTKNTFYYSKMRPVNKYYKYNYKLNVDDSLVTTISFLFIFNRLAIGSHLAINIKKVFT